MPSGDDVGSGVPAAGVGDSELEARMTGLEQQVSTMMEAQMSTIMGQLMGQVSSMIKEAVEDGGRSQRGESSGDGGAPTGASGDAAAPNSNQWSAAAGTAGGGRNFGGVSPPGEIQATSSVVGGELFSGGTAGGGVFPGGGGISRVGATATVLKRGATEYPGWRKDLMIQAGIQNFADVFTDGGVMPDVSLPQQTLVNQGFSHAAIQKTYAAWNFLSAALTTETDRDILRRCTSPREALQQLDAAYLPETQGAQQMLFREFQQYSTPKRDNPVASLNKLMGMATMMEQGGGASVNEQFVFSRLIDSLPLPEYEVTKQTLAVFNPLTRDVLVAQLSTRFNALSEQWRKEGKKGSGGEQAYVVDTGTVRKSKGGRSGKANGHSKDNRVDHRRCYRCNHRGHMRPDCTTKEEDFLEQCDTCSGFGHNSKQCPTPTAATETSCVAVVEHALTGVVVSPDEAEAKRERIFEQAMAMSAEEKKSAAERTTSAESWGEFDDTYKMLSTTEPGWDNMTVGQRSVKVLDLLDRAF